jgi:subtilisin family serine protease
VFIAAPGRRILVQKSGINYSASGSSYAAPCVAGVVALMLEHYPKLTVEGVRYWLQKGATTNAYWVGKNSVGGILNAANSLPPVFSWRLGSAGPQTYNTYDIQSSEDLVNWKREEEVSTIGQPYVFKDLATNSHKFYKYYHSSTTYISSH